MNQSMGTDSFGKSLLEKCTNALQQESVNELWKGNFPSSQSTAQNTNEVYENLLRICEEIDAALPEIQSTVNKGGLHIAEPRPENRLDAPFMAQHETFDDIETNLDDIEIYGDIMNQNQIFAENEIEQYITRNNFKLNSERYVQNKTREDDVEDPLRLWHKLNCNKIEELPDRRDKSPEPEEIDEAEQKTNQDEVKNHRSLRGRPSKPRKCKTGLPVLVVPTTEPTEKKEKSQNKILEQLKQDLILSSSSSRESSVSPSPGTSKRHKRKQKTPSDKKSKPVKKKHKKKKSDDPPNHKSKITSPTLKAGAAYIEQQLSTFQVDKTKNKKTSQPSQSFKKNSHKPDKHRSRKETGQGEKHRKYYTRSHSRQNNNEKREKKSDKQDDWKWLYCSSLSSSPISTPSTKTISPLSSKSSTIGSPKTKRCNSYIENDENNNRVKVLCAERIKKGTGREQN